MADRLARVAAIINEILEIGSIVDSRIEQDLTKLGMNSILFIHTIVRLEEEFDIEIPDSYLLLTEMNTLQKINTAIEAICVEKQALNGRTIE